MSKGMGVSTGDISNKLPLKATGSNSSLPSSPCWARSPIFCPQTAGWALKGWSKLTIKENNRYRMETETLGWGRLWRLRGDDRWREKLLERMLSAEKGTAYMTPSEHSLNSYTQSHTLILLMGRSMCFQDHHILLLPRVPLNGAVSFLHQRFSTFLSFYC